MKMVGAACSTGAERLKPSWPVLRGAEMALSRRAMGSALTKSFRLWETVLCCLQPSPWLSAIHEAAVAFEGIGASLTFPSTRQNAA